MALTIRHGMWVNPDTDAPRVSREVMTAALQLQGWAPYRATIAAVDAWVLLPDRR